MKARILLVEDEPDVALVVSDLLGSAGYRVEIEPNGTTGLNRANGNDFDLLILDVMLPGATGLAICQKVREQGYDGAILMLTAKAQIRDRVRGLRTGADDYITKPFSPAELLARTEALLRRVHKQNLTPVMRFQFGEVVANFAESRFTKAGHFVGLAPKEVELLRLLINHRGQVLPRQRILEQVWKEQKYITAKTVDVHIAWLRQKLEDKPERPRFILTVRGIGYSFKA